MRSPDKRLWVLVSFIQVGKHGVLQLASRRMAFPPNTTLGYLRNWRLHQVKPTAAGRRKTNISSPCARPSLRRQVPRVAGQPIAPPWAARSQTLLSTRRPGYFARENVLNEYLGVLRNYDRGAEDPIRAAIWRHLVTNTQFTAAWIACVGPDLWRPEFDPIYEVIERVSTDERTAHEEAGKFLGLLVWRSRSKAAAIHTGLRRAC